MNSESILVAAVFVPVIGAFLLPMAERISLGFRNGLSFCLVLVSLLCSIALVPAAMAGRVVTVCAAWPLGLSFALRADGLAVFTAMVSSGISAVIVLYSTSYISHYRHQGEYYVMVVLFLGGMMGLVFSGNLILLYIFWEITAITSWRLIGFFREETHVIRANKAFLVTVFGALAMLLGFVILAVQTGTFDLAALKVDFKGSTAPGVAVALILLGIFSKSATLPFHTWLPDAGVAPSPVTALLHAALLVKIGVYVFARVLVATFELDEVWRVATFLIAGLSALVSAGAAMVETDTKRIIAYSTVSQIAFIFLGLASGSAIGIAGALLYVLMHGLAKAGLFLCAGIIEQRTGERDIRQLGGLIRTMPVTGVAFLLCAMSVMGVPPFGGFFSKYMVFSGAIQSGHWGFALLFLAGAFLTIIYLFRIFNAIFLGEPKGAPVTEGSPLMVGCVALLALLSLGGGILIRYPSALALQAVRQMLGVMP